MKEEITLTGWVARDAYFDALSGMGLIIHDKKPTRSGVEWVSVFPLMHLNWNLFPDLTWEDEPLEVEITIKQKNMKQIIEI